MRSLRHILRGRSVSSRRMRHQAQDELLLAGQVCITAQDGGEVLAKGKNRLTLAARVNVLRMIALTGSHAARDGVSFINDEGVSLPLTPADTLLPAYITAGTSATATTGLESALIAPIVDAQWTLARVDVRESAAAYGSSPLFVAFEFDIPQGSLDPGDVTAFVTVQEWGLHASDGTLLARFVQPLIKAPSLALVLRWEWLG